jgi:hypothetical protein
VIAVPGAIQWAAKFLVTISDRQLIQSIGPPGPIVRARSGEKTLEQIEPNQKVNL